jgi:uncharacterized protein YkwD
VRVRSLRLVIVVVVALVVLAPRASATDGDAIEYDALARALVDELNVVRADPRAYAKTLVAVRATVTDGAYRSSAGRTIALREGASVVDGAVAALVAAKPLAALAKKKPLRLAADGHARDLGARGAFGHRGHDGSTLAARIARETTLGRGEVGEVISYGATTAREIVHGFLIDDGVADRGHRHAILDDGFVSVGAACAHHTKHTPVCVVNFAAAR